MRFYRIDNSDLYKNTKYAYMSINKDNQHKKTDTDEIMYTYFKCKYCGFEERGRFFPSRFIGVFCKDSVGDFTSGEMKYGGFAFSQKALETMKKYNITGLRDIKKYNRLETTRYKPITSIEGGYYNALLDYEYPIITRYYDPIKREEYDQTGEYIISHYAMEAGCCKKCATRLPKKYPYVFRQTKDTKLYFKDLKKITKDIFIPKSKASLIIVSERFKEMCEKEKLTNIKFVEVYDEEDYVNE